MGTGVRQNTQWMPPFAEIDVAQGLFETLRVAGGEPVELDAHLERIGASCEELLEAPLPPRTGELVRERAAGIPLGRLRLTVTASPSGPRAEATVAAVDPDLVFPSPEHGAAALRTLRLAGGLGAHKWVDRTALAGFQEPEVALLVDADGSVLEASRANVFAVRDGQLLTPPTDGRILPGTARGALFEVAVEAGIEVGEQRLALDDLRTADEVFLTGSVRGLQRAGSLDGEPLPPAGEISRRLAAGLKRRWRLADAAAIAPVPAAGPPPGPRAR
ncbi:MAG TPA: aminotransferase class IV [Solirubrobacterales bacterium]|nr:aminotransferase class IV [Solirubrobacterales bacterium]